MLLFVSAAGVVVDVGFVVVCCGGDGVALCDICGTLYMFCRCCCSPCCCCRIVSVHFIIF